VTLADLYWLAGLFEGEGCVSVQGRTPTLGIAMADRDVIARVGELWGVTPSVQRYNSRVPNTRTLWRVRLHGRRAMVWMERLFPHLGARRQQRIFDVAFRVGS